MKHLKALVLMQLKDKLDFSFLKSKQKTIAKVVFSILGFVALVFICYALFKIAELLGLFSLINIVPLSVITLFYTFMFCLSVITCTWGLTKTLYFAKDNQVLLTFPIRLNQVFVSKLIVYYIYELIKNFYFVAPMFIAYAVLMKFSFAFYPWFIFCFFFLTMLPVLIGGILSIPVMFITYWLKQLPVLRLISGAGILALVIYLVLKLISFIPADLNLIETWPTLIWEIEDFLYAFEQTMVPFSLITEMLCGRLVNLHFVLFSINTLYIFLGIIGANLVLFGICFVASRPLFFKMASKPFEYKKRIIKKHYKNSKKNSLYSGFTTSIKRYIRTPELLYNYLGILFALPIAILLLNKIFEAMSKKLLGLYMTYTFNVLLVLLIILSCNVMVSSLYSRDGRASYYFKTMPKKYYEILSPRLLLSIVVGFISILSTTIIITSFLKMSAINTILLFLFLFLVYVGHLFWSAELDIMNPQNEEFATTGSCIHNPNERKSTLIAFMLAFVLSGITMFLLVENEHIVWVKMAVIALAFALLRIYLYFIRIKVYYEEK